MFRPEHPHIKIFQSDELTAKLLTQLRYDNVKRSDFYKIIVEAYLNRDSRIISLIEESCKKPTSKIRKTRIKDLEKIKSTINDYLLDENEVKNIFDMLAKENSDL